MISHIALQLKQFEKIKKKYEFHYYLVNFFVLTSDCQKSEEQ